MVGTVLAALGVNSVKLYNSPMEQADCCSHFKDEETEVWVHEETPLAQRNCIILDSEKFSP